MTRPNKCPHCHSKKVIVNGTRFYCKKCGFLNEQERVVIRSS